MSVQEWAKLIDKEVLISLVEERPALWDKNLDKYKDNAAICVILNKDFENREQKQRQEFGKLVLKKWRKTRDAWVRTLRDKKNCKTSGSAALKLRPYKYHHQMLFLKKIIQPCETHESVSTKNTDEVDTTAINGNNTTKEDDSDHIEQLGDGTHSDKKVSPQAKRRAPTKNINNEIDAKMISYLDHQIKPKKLEPDDRNLSFFKGILPSSALLNDDEVLEFQSGVIKLLQNIKSRKVSQPPYYWSAPYMQASGASNNQTEGYFAQASGSNNQTQNLPEAQNIDMGSQNNESIPSPSTCSDENTLELSLF